MSDYRCRHCGNPAGVWYFGWKHQTGGRSKPSCGRKLTAADIVRVTPARDTGHN